MNRHTRDEPNRIDDDNEPGVEGIEITCSFCGRRGRPGELAEHWCPGRRAFVTGTRSD